MKTIHYKKFDVYYPSNEEVTIDNFFKHNITIYAGTDLLDIISKEEVSLHQVKGLLSGDDNKAVEALKSIIQNRKRAIHLLETQIK